MAHIQAVGGAAGAGAAGSAAGTFPGNSSFTAIGSGNSVILYLALVQQQSTDTGTPTTSNITVTDNATGSPNTGKYTVADVGASISAFGNNVYPVQIYGINLTGGPTTVTLTGSGFTWYSQASAMGMDEFSTELAGGKTLNQHRTDSGASSVTGADAFKGTTVSPTGTGLAFAWAVQVNGTTAITKGSAFTAGLTDTSDNVWSEYIVSNSSPVASTWNATVVGDIYHLGIMTFAPAVAPAPTPCNLGTQVLLGIGCWAAMKVKENPRLTRRDLIVPRRYP